MNTDTIDSVLGIVPEREQIATIPAELPAEPPISGELVPVQEQTAIAIVDPVRDAQRLEDDFEFARDKVRDLVKKGREACDSAILLAQSGDSPRAYEVVATMLTALVNANRELVALHKGKLDATPEIASSRGTSLDGGASVNIEKAVFVGRAQDLLREIRAIAAAKSEAPAIDITPIDDAQTQPEQ